MDIYIGADHNGFELKNDLLAWLKEKGHNVQDLGPMEFDKNDDYPDYGVKVAKAVADAPDNSVGIVICGSGVGMSVVAGKVRGIRAGLIHDPAIAESARNDDNINVLALGASFISPEQAKEVISSWLGTEFSGEDRHVRRLYKIKQYETEHGCRCTARTS